MIVKENFSLEHLNTFAIKATAKQYVELNAAKDLEVLMKENILTNQKYLVLGSGSNILFTQDYDGVVVKVNNKGVSVTKTENKVYLEVSAGENWDEFVAYCVENNFGGLENLSLIPGTVGASPYQNIGAYGVEVKDNIEKVEAFDLIKQKFVILSNQECQFSYRNSIFKENPNRYIILKVYFCLDISNHQLVLDYGDIKAELEKNGIENPSILDIRNTVIHIRNSKLPNPKELPNAGSFFKNPVVNNLFHKNLQKKYIDLKSFKTHDGYKIAAGWMIEKLGWKGKKFGNVGVHEKQALVLVNYKDGKGIEIYDLSEKIIQSVQKEFNITLEREVRIE